MKKILVSMFLLVFGLYLVGCEQPHTDPEDEFYMNGIYNGECIYVNPASSVIPTEKNFEFVNNKYNNIEYIKLESILGFFDGNPGFYINNELDVEKLETNYDAYYYELNVKDDFHQGTYIFKYDNELLLFEANYNVNGDIKKYTIWFGYKLIKQEYITLATETFEVEQSEYDYICGSYNIEFNQLYYVIDNYERYLQLYSLVSRKDKEPLDKESGEQMFKDKVIICYPRIVSGSRDFIPVEYRYYENTSEIKFNWVNIKDGPYPDVEVAYCFDFVEVPKDIFNKIVK